MQMLEEEEVEVPVSSTSDVPKDATRMETDDAPQDPASSAGDHMQEPKGAADPAEGAAENGGQDSEEKTVPMDTDTKVLFYSLLYRISMPGLLLAACFEELFFSAASNLCLH